jgi:hypothetical protein
LSHRRETAQLAEHLGRAWAGPEVADLQEREDELVDAGVEPIQHFRRKLRRPPIRGLRVWWSRKRHVVDKQVVEHTPNEYMSDAVSKS